MFYIIRLSALQRLQCSVLYGVAVGTMWLRMLDFVLVQKDLGKVLKKRAEFAESGAALMLYC